MRGSSGMSTEHESGQGGASADARPEVSVIIVSWNTLDLVLDCIESIHRETVSDHEIILIDNASADGTAEIIAQRHPEVRLIANQDNRGFAAANNQGIEIAQGRLVLLLNPDTVILEGAIDRSIEKIDSDDGIGVLGCQVWETPDRIQLTSFRFEGVATVLESSLGLTRLVNRLPWFETAYYVNWDRRSDRDVEVVSGMFMLVPRDVIDRTGSLDERFFIYAEEADLCWRVRQIGLKNHFWCGARIMHLDGGSKSTEQIRPRMHVQMLKSKLQFIRKNRGVISHALCWLIITIGLLIRWVGVGVLSLLRGREKDRKRCRVWFGGLRWLLTGATPD